MIPRNYCRLILSMICLFCLCAHGAVSTIRTPHGGIQPQAAVDAAGVLHLIYYKGDPAAGDLFYVRRAGSEEFSDPVRVNQLDGSAVAAGTIRGGHLSVGREGRVHVAWMGSSKFASEGGGGHKQHPMFYARMNDERSGFEKERNLLTWTRGLDGGGSVAADGSGNVYVAWHGSEPGNEKGEAGRAVFVSRSTDDGATFSRERRAEAEPAGACGCCGMRAFVDSRERLHLLYRTANERTRDMALLSSRDGGKTFSSTSISSWAIQACPMSSASFAEGARGLLLGFENEGRIGIKRVEVGASETGSLDLSEARGKHPAIAASPGGAVLVAWSEGAGWAKGGVLRWQVFDGAGAPTGKRGRMEGVPVWSLPTAVALPGEEFLIVF